MPDKSGSQLFQPLRLGALQLPNRIVMAPMTRGRAMEKGRITPLAAQYYAERAEAGLIIAEATWITPEGMGAMHTPGIWKTCHVEAWREVTQAVHAAGGRIALQLWHVGRISHSLLQPGGGSPVAPSAIGARGEIETPAGRRSLPVPRELTPGDMPRLVADFADAAERARDAGFDAVEIHAAHGYLLDQFLRSGTNRRLDAYGGPPDNRARLVVEVAVAVAGRIGADRVGLRISPHNPHHDIADDNPRGTFTTLAHLLRPLGLAWLHLVESAADAARGAPRLARELRSAFGGPLLLCGRQTRETAEQALASGEADAVAFGRPFIANPDLPARLLASARLAEPDAATIHAGGAAGYVGYPTARASIAA